MKKFIKTKLGVPENWDKHDYQLARYSFEDIEEVLLAYEKEQLRLGVVSRSNAIDYAEGFELAMDFIDKHPADPDVTSEQLSAWIKLQDFVNKSDCKKQRIITD